MQKKSIIRSFRGLTLGVCAAALTGCAVMTIDVDVYKGPLVNQDDVQEHQFALLAVSVKPLLVQLRDTLECEEREISAKDCAKLLANQEFRERSKYERDWIPDFYARIFQSAAALRANDILYLYKDEVPSAPAPVRRIFDEFSPLLKRLGAASDTLLPKDQKDITYWESLEKQLAKRKADLEKTLGNKHSAIKARDCLVETYKSILAPALHKSNDDGTPSGWRDATPHDAYLPKVCDASAIPESQGSEKSDSTSVSKAASILYNRLNSKQRVTVGPLTKAIAIEATDARNHLSSDREYALLAQQEIVRQHALVLFGKEPEDLNVDAFIKRVNEIAQAYNTVRRQNKNIWSLAVDSLANVNSLDIDAATQSDVTNRLVEIIGETTELVRLALILNVEGDTRVSDLRARIAKQISGKSDTAIIIRRQGKGFNYEDFRTIRRGLKRVLVSDPAEMANALRMASQLFENVADYPTKYVQDAGLISIGMQDLAKRYTFPESRSYGATFSFNNRSRLEEIVRVVSEQTAISAGGVAAGRPKDGLETLTIQYEREIVKGNSAKLDELRVKLERALVHFGEKLTKLADNQILIDSDQPKITKFTTALQSFGNSIIVNADHVFRRRGHEKNDADTGKAELTAWTQAMGRTQSDIVDDLVALLSSEVDEKQAARDTQKTALAAVTAKIKYADDARTKRGGRNYTTAHDDKDPAKTFKTEVDKRAMVLDAHAELSANQAAIVAETNKPANVGPNATMAQLITGVNAWLKTRLGVFGAADAAHPDHVQVINAQGYMSSGAPSFEGDTAAATTDSQFTKFITTLNNSRGRANTYLTDLTKAESELKKAEKAAQGALGKADTTLKSITAQRELLKSKKAAILSKARGSKVPEGDPDRLIDVVIGILDEEVKSQEKAKEGETDSEKIKAADAAIAAAKSASAAVQKQKPRIALLKAPSRLTDDDGNPRDARASDVIDQFISLLRFGETLAIQQGNTERVEDYRDAIESAERQKADKIFIRPAAAYLRSSFAATGLQDNASFAWKNMLARHSFRDIPLIGEALTNASDKERLKILNQVDKQFWQNINRVRVAGAGDTNYAITKDDIGNWYVKSYSADPKDIIKSAQSLALFNIGGQLGNVDLLNSARTTAENQQQQTDEVAKRSVERPALARLFDKHKESYETKAMADFTKLVELLGEDGLKKKIADTWAENSDTKSFSPDLKANLNAAFPEEDNDRDAFAHKTDGQNNPLDGTALAAKIPSGLRLALRYYRVLAASIPGTLLTDTKVQALANAKAQVTTAENNLKQAQEALNPTPDDVSLKQAVETRKSELEAAQGTLATNQKAHDDAERGEKAALKTAAVLTKDVIESYLTSRISNVEGYETAIGFIGDATNP